MKLGTAVVVSLEEYVRDKGYMAMCSREPLPLGPFARNDWEEDELCQWPWAVIGDSSKAELEEQNRATGWDGPVDPAFRYFYRVVVID